VYVLRKDKHGKLVSPQPQYVMWESAERPEILRVVKEVFGITIADDTPSTEPGKLSADCWSFGGRC
jgi:hypothetical protein